VDSELFVLFFIYSIIKEVEIVVPVRVPLKNGNSLSDLIHL
jgi:hypothetical protein